MTCLDSPFFTMHNILISLTHSLLLSSLLSHSHSQQSPLYSILRFLPFAPLARRLHFIYILYTYSQPVLGLVVKCMNEYSRMYYVHCTRQQRQKTEDRGRKFHILRLKNEQVCVHILEIHTKYRIENTETAGQEAKQATHQRAEHRTEQMTIIMREFKVFIDYYYHYSLITIPHPPYAHTHTLSVH